MDIFVFVLILHVLGATILVGGTVFSIFFLSKKSLPLDFIKQVLVFGEFMKYAALSQLITGSILFMHEPDKFRGNKFFWLKLALYVISGILAGKVMKGKAIEIQKGKKSSIKGIYKWFLFHLLILLAIVSIGVLLVESD
jgi:uncharacterized membrane protein